MGTAHQRIRRGDTIMRIDAGAVELQLFEFNQSRIFLAGVFFFYNSVYFFSVVYLSMVF